MENPEGREVEGTSESGDCWKHSQPVFSMPRNDKDRLHVTTFIFAINLMKHT